MIAIHHFPNAYSPIDRIKDFKDYLSSMNVPSSLTFDDKKNTAMIDFIMITNNHMPIVLEFNIFKYEKSKKCGSVAVQYVKRYSATTTMQIEEIKKDFEKNRKHLIKQIKRFNIPQIVTTDIDKCISGIEVNHKDDNKIKDESTTSIANISIENIPDKESIVSESKSEENSIENIDDSISEDIVNSDISNEDKFKNEEAAVDSAKICQEIINKETDDELCDDTKSITQSNDKAVEERENNTKLNLSSEINTEIKNIENTVHTQPIKTNKKHKNIKEISYNISNNKENLISTPRTNKELKQEVKLKRIKHKEALKIQKKQLKIENKEKKMLIKQGRKQVKVNIKEERAKIKSKIKEQKQQAKIDRIEDKMIKRGEKLKAKLDKIEDKKQAKLKELNNKYAKKEARLKAKEEVKKAKYNKTTK